MFVGDISVLVNDGIHEFCRKRTAHKVVEVGIYTIDNIAVEIVERLSYFRDADYVGPLSVTYEGGIGSAFEGEELVAVERNLEVAVPVEIAGNAML